jgi:hypothetical protein
VFSKQHRLTLALRVYLVENGLSIFRNTGREHDYLVEFAHIEDEILRIWPHVDVDRLYEAIDINWLLDISILDLLEAGVDQSLIQVQDECFLPDVAVLLGF